MKKLLPIILVTLIIFCSACKKSEDIPDVVAEERTVLVYVAANTNNLASYARDDIEEMALGMKEADDTRYNLVVYSDMNSNPVLFRFGKDQDGKVVRDTIFSYPAQDSLDPEIMQSVFSKAFNAYPAKSYGLVLWTHAEGWIPAFTRTKYIGPSSNVSMDIADFKGVLEKNAIHFDYIYFETCFMSGIEVLYELRKHADYIIACPTETPGTGAPYDLVLEAMLTNKPQEIGKIYFDYYDKLYIPGTIPRSDWTAGVNIAVIKSDALEQFAAKTRQILPNYLSPQEEISRNGILSYDPLRYNYYYDMDQFIKTITSGNEDYLEWKTYYDKVVVYFETTATIYSGGDRNNAGLIPMTGAEGLTTYIPRSSHANIVNPNDGSNILDFYKTYEWYVAGGWQDAGLQIFD